jgi:hypothetical protein
LTAAALTDSSEDEWSEKDDFTLCWYCGHIMAFNADRSLRNLTDPEMAEALRTPEIILMRRAQAQLRAQGKLWTQDARAAGRSTPGNATVAEHLEAQRAGWISRQDESYGLLVWTHPDHPGLKYFGAAINIPEKYRRS